MFLCLISLKIIKLYKKKKKINRYPLQILYKNESLDNFHIHRPFNFRNKGIPRMTIKARTTASMTNGIIPVPSATAVSPDSTRLALGMNEFLDMSEDPSFKRENFRTCFINHSS